MKIGQEELATAAGKNCSLHLLSCGQYLPIGLFNVIVCITPAILHMQYGVKKVG